MLSFFQDWISYIVAHDSSHGFGAVNAGGSLPYELNYKINYAVVTTIELVSPAGLISTTVTLNQSYPIFIGDVQLAWENNTSIMKIPVHFSFFDYFITLGPIPGGGVTGLVAA